MVQQIKNIHRDEINYVKVNRSAVESSVCEARMVFHRRRLESRLEHNYIPALNCWACVRSCGTIRPSRKYFSENMQL